MTMQDPITDLCTRIRNAQAVHRSEVTMSSSNMKKSILNILKEEGYISDFTEQDVDNKKSLTIMLKYFKKTPVINMIKRISRPGLRSYKGKDNLPEVPGFGIAVVTTSKGVMTAKAAKSQGIGGEVVCIVN